MNCTLNFGWFYDYVSRGDIFEENFFVLNNLLGWVDDSSCLWLRLRSMNRLRKYLVMSASMYNPLWSDLTIEQNGRMSHLVTNLYIILVQNRKSIWSDPLTYEFYINLWLILRLCFYRWYIWGELLCIE